MAGYNITQFSAADAIGMYEAGQNRRMQQLLYERKIAADDREIEQKNKTAAAWAKIFQPKGGDPSSMSGAYGAPASPAASQPSATAPSAAPTGVAPSVGAPAGGTGINRDAIPGLLALDPEQGFALMKHLQTMDKAGVEAAAERNAVLSRGAQHLLSIPREPRAAELQRIAPVLVQAGITAEQIQGFDPNNDNALGFIVNQGRDIEKIIADTKITWHQQGEQPSFATYSSGQLVNPGAVGANTAGGGSPATATNSKTGERIQFNPQTNSWEPINGGASQPGSQTFP